MSHIMRDYATPQRQAFIRAKSIEEGERIRIRSKLARDAKVGVIQNWLYQGLNGRKK
jgi:hypothetical protein